MQLTKKDLEEIVEEETKDFRRKAALKVLDSLLRSPSHVPTTHIYNLPEIAVVLADKLIEELNKDKDKES